MGWQQNLCLLPEAESPMFTPFPNTSAALARALLIHYSFDLSGYTASELVGIWQKQFSADWLHLAVIEALYQGRYKAVSVQQILIFWHRRGQATFHFNMEFERLICSKFPESLTLPASPNLPLGSRNNSTQQLSHAESSPTAKLPPVSLPTTSSVMREDKGSSAQQTKTQEIRSFYTGNRSEKDTGNLAKPSVSSNTSPSYSISSFSPTVSQRLKLPTSAQSSIPNQQPKSLPATTHPPIGQFTPNISKRSDPFTSKLQAMSHDKQRRFYSQEESEEQ